MSDNEPAEQPIDFARAIADTSMTAEEAAQNMRRQLQALPTLEDVIASMTAGSEE